MKCIYVYMCIYAYICTYMHKTMVSVVNLEKIEIIRSREFMPSEVRLKFLKKMIILGPKTAILGPQFCRILVLGLIFGGQGEPRPLGPPWIHPCLGGPWKLLDFSLLSMHSLHFGVPFYTIFEIIKY